MSFIVKGVDLPKEGRSIYIEVFPNGRCSVMEIETGECYDLEIRSKAEAVQIPKGHGDIKDVSEFIKAVDHAHDNVWNRDDWLDENMRGLLRDTKKRIEKLPTILEAEDET